MGSLRFRRSIGISKGVRLNLNKTGVGVSFGTRGARYSINTSGRRTSSVGIPGTGVRYQGSKGGGSRRAGPRGGGTTAPAPAPRRAAPVSPPAPPHPGVFAPGYEKAFYKGIQQFAAGNAEAALTLFREASEKDTKGAMVSDDLFTGLMLTQTGDDVAAIPYFEKVVASPEALPDALMQKYVPRGGVHVNVTDLVTVDVPFGSFAAALMLAECYQENGREQEAIGLLHQLVEVQRHPFLVLSLCDVLFQDEEWEEVVELAAGTRNEDDVSMQLGLYQGMALERLGHDDAALEVYREMLRSRKRNPELLKRARYQRGRLYMRMGKKSQAKRDLAQVYADDPGFRDVAETLGQLEN